MKNIHGKMYKISRLLNGVFKHHTQPNGRLTVASLIVEGGKSRHDIFFYLHQSIIWIGIKRDMRLTFFKNKNELSNMTGAHVKQDRLLFLWNLNSILVFGEVRVAQS